MRNITLHSMICAAFFLAGLPLSAWAQEGFEEEGVEELLYDDIPVVITATLTEKPVHKAPSTMTVYTEKQIKAMGVTRLSQLLERVPGVSTRFTYINTQALNMRGIQSLVNNKSFKYLLNGHTIVDPLRASFMELRDFNLENIKQVEIIRGPGSCLLGTNAFAGIINVITKKPEEIDGTVVDIKYSSFHTKEGYIGFGKKFNNELETAFHVKALDTKGPNLILESDALKGTPLTICPTGMDEKAKKHQTSFDLNYKGFSFTTSFINSDTDVPIPDLDFLTERGEDRELRHWYAEASQIFALSETLTIKPKMSFDAFKFVFMGQILPNGFVYPLDTDGDGDIEYWPNGGEVDSSNKIDEFRSELLFDYKTNGSNRFLFGLFYEKSTLKDIVTKANIHPLYFSSSDVMVDYSNTSFNWALEGDRTISGFFFQNEWDITHTWYLVFGGRYDHYSDFGSTFNPRTALVWDYNNKGGIMKLIYNTAFNAPNFHHLYNNNIGIVGNPDLDAEDLTSYEVSLTDILFGKIQSHIAMYYIKTKNLIDYSKTRHPTKPGGPLFYVNSGKTRHIGLEITEKYHFFEGNHIYGSYSYTDAEDKETKRGVPFVPLNQFSIGLNLFLADILNWNINMDYTGKLPREAGDTRPKTEARILLDTSLRIVNDKDWDLFVSVFNLSNERFYAPSPLASSPVSDFPRPGRTYTAGVSYKF